MEQNSARNSKQVALFGGKCLLHFSFRVSSTGGVNGRLCRCG